jgi:tetratricopeptide (TPR) repeat protein
MERRMFPGAHELVAGYFVRHSDAYYQWRIDDRMAKSSDQQIPSDLDDIAVAHDKLGNHDQAIETMLEKINRWPKQGRYESEANLGTFYIHAGQLEEGLKHIRNAIAINPDAHFGREIYQQLLVEYLLEKQNPSGELPVYQEQGWGRLGFTEFLLAAQNPAEDAVLEELQAAAKGVMGMMRFGNHDSPVLLEALGDLMLADESNFDSKMLATRAYLRASMEVDDPKAIATYRHKAFTVIEMQENVELSQVEQQLVDEISQGEALFHRISEDESAWIDAGLDVDAEFETKYFSAPTPTFDVEEDETQTTIGALSATGVAVCIGSLVAGLIAIAVVARKRSGSRKMSAM